MSTATAIKGLVEEVRTKRGRVAAIFDAKKRPDGTYDLTPEERSEVKSLNDELNEKVPKLEQLQADERLASENAAALKSLETRIRRPGMGGRTPSDGIGLESTGEFKSIGDLFVGHDAYKSLLEAEPAANKWDRFNLNLESVDLKTLFQTSAGWDPFVARGPQVVLSAQQQPKVVDLLPMSETSQAAVKWMLETTYTNAAAEVAEAGTYPESAFALTEQTSSVRKIAVTLPMTDEQLDDEPRSRDYLNNRLTLNLKQRLDSQLLTGNGTAPNLRGLYNVVGIQTQARGTDPHFDALFKAMVKVQNTAFTDPSAIILHPTDWQTIRLLRTADGIYILGNPGEVGPSRVWGLPVVTTTYATLGSGIVADFAGYTELVYRKGISFEMTNSHGTEFIEGKQRMRAQLRVAFIVYRPAAVCTVTGL